jgi:type VII secretion integral membrane protein EccD
MARYSRVTLVGRRRRADVVLPSDEPIGVLLPDVLNLLDEPVGRVPRPRQLVTGDGHALPTGQTLATAEVPDGTILRLVAVEDSPPAPAIHDVTEETAEGADRLSLRWNPTARRWSATVAAVVLFAVTGLLLEAISPGRGGVVALAGAAAVGCLLGAALAQVREAVGTVVLLGASVLAVQAGWFGAKTGGWSPAERWLLLAALASVLLALLGITTPLGRGGWVGGILGVVLVGLWWAGVLAHLPAARLAAVMAVVAVVLLGFLPRLALLTAGLTRLDDARTAGGDVTRRDVGSALVAAHRGLLLAVIVVAASIAVSGWLLAGHPSRWSLALAGLLVIILLSRARLYPLVGEVLALLAAAGVGLAGLLLAWLHHAGGGSGGALAVAGAGAFACVLLLAVNPAEHLRARLRRLADRIEAAAVLAAVPVVVGVFGTYGRLLHIF